MRINPCNAFIDQFSPYFTSDQSQPGLNPNPVGTRGLQEGRASVALKKSKTAGRKARLNHQSDIERCCTRTSFFFNVPGGVAIRTCRNWGRDGQDIRISLTQAPVDAGKLFVGKKDTASRAKRALAEGKIINKHHPGSRRHKENDYELQQYDYSLLPAAIFLERGGPLGTRLQSLFAPVPHSAFTYSYAAAPMDGNAFRFSY